jgi:hypothetical protein
MLAAMSIPLEQTHSRNPVRLMTSLTIIAVAFYTLLWFGDFGLHHPEQTPLRLWLDAGTVQAVYGLLEAMVGILAVALTVISILVELAATRYTPRITEIFLRDRVNITILCFFVLTTVLVFWVSLSLSAGHSGTYPQAMVLTVELGVSISLLALLPYFAYVFEFLSPHQLVRRIALDAVTSLERLARGGPVDRTHAEVGQAIEYLGDIALKSVQNQDKDIATDAVLVLGQVLEAHLKVKGSLPASWFDVDRLLEDSDFVAFHREVLRSLGPRRTWLEMKALLQLQATYNESTHGMREVAHLVAIQVRQLTVMAAEAGDEHALVLGTRFLNTFMRSAINARDVRTAYNLFNEYRLLCRGLLGTSQQARLVEVAGFMKTYGQLAFHANLKFILETAAFDLGRLLEDVHDAGAPEHPALLRIFLDVDREAAGEVQEHALRGVRKAQVKLATYYLERGEIDLARRIQQDMRHEDRDRLLSIRREIEQTTEREFWEISDRGVNFDYLSPGRRAQLETFYQWFTPGS